ncbi:hypothetical protein PFICI_09913 [Pestalotiopsis fici W106-1]|uniref:Uncharacterized protein n=1 Tax=Pestalotiopsis fici (strain W106-1 / CGMCC3.15140) TaxID=1229662 RepID=W3WY85_PESFW|nr:uncharacterized protein PFICI_09913 [Pestalotiopsis fici W106-1]ETS77851.1 hypothetical protein PFICI_09913 [Pestalotiopsis fici W106-1]
MERLKIPLGTLLDAVPPIRDMQDKLRETVVAPLQDNIGDMVNKLADLALTTGSNIAAVSSSSSTTRIPPFDPDNPSLDPHANSACVPEARALLVKLRAEMGRNMPLDKQDKTQDPQNPANRAGKLADFGPVLARVDWAAVAAVAEDVAWRAGLASKYRGPVHVHVGEPRFGTMSVGFPLIWQGSSSSSSGAGAGANSSKYGRKSSNRKDGDAKKWFIKIPINGTPNAWHSSDERALASEVGTMRWLRRELGVHTNLNIPRVYHWDGSAGETSRDGTRNRIRVPYMMMQYVDGISAHDAWFTRWGPTGWWRPEAEELRRGILSNVAAAMSELRRFEFESGGAPRYQFVRDARGRETEELLGVGPLRILDIEAMLDRWLCHLSPEEKLECKRTPIYRELGPWKGKDAVKNYYTSRIDCHNVRENSDFGSTMLLESYFKWWHESDTALGVGYDDESDEEDEEELAIQRWNKGEKKPFVLTHHDLNLHNIIIDQQGKLWFIGWSGVACVPRAIGNEALPLWLVRDWNPFVYRWRDMDWPWRYRHCPWRVPVTEDNSTEEATWRLSGWRQYYAECMNEAKKAWRDVEKDANERRESREQESRPRARRKEAEESEFDRAELSSPKGEEERRGRPRYRFGEEPPEKSKTPPPGHQGVRHVSFASDTKPAPGDRRPSSKSSPSSTNIKSCPRLNRTLLSALPLSLSAAANDPRSRPFILQELYHRAVPSVPRWDNFAVSRLRHLAGECHENVPSPFEIESRELFYRTLLDCAGVARGRHRPWAARLGDYND